MTPCVSIHAVVFTLTLPLSLQGRGERTTHAKPGSARSIKCAWHRYSSLTKAERNEILRHNAASLRLDYGLEVEQINASLASVRRLGFASGLVDRRLPGYTGLAVPILDAGGQAIGALSCALARPRMTDARRQALVQAMTQEAQQVVRHLGG